MNRHHAATTIAAMMIALTACEKKQNPPTPGGSAPHAESSGGHDHGPTTDLGEKSASGFTVRASRDGDITPGHDAPIDAWITGDTASIAAVRFWIGTRDARGSVKAKAELEHDNWHTHADVPSPLPEGSSIWIEIETNKGERVAIDFPLGT